MQKTDTTQLNDAVAHLQEQCLAAWELRLGKPQEAVEKLQGYLSQAEQLGDVATLGYVNLLLGIANFTRSDYPQALNCYHHAQRFYESIQDAEGLARTANAFGNLYEKLGSYSLSLSEHLNSLRYAQDAAIPQLEAYALNGAAAVYYSLGLYEDSMAAHLKSLEIKRRLGDKRGEANSLGNLGLVYEKLNALSDASDAHHQSLAIRLEIEDKRGEAISLNNLGLVLEKSGDLNSAQLYMEQAIDILRAMNEQRIQSEVLLNLNHIYIKQYASGDVSRLAAIVENWTRGLQLAEAIDAKKLQSEFYFDMYSFYKRYGDTAVALTYHEQYHALREADFSTESEARINAIRVQHDLELSQRQVKVEQTKRIEAETAYALLSEQKQQLNASYQLIESTQVQLAHAYDMAEEAQRKSDQLLLNILPAPIADRLKQGQTTIADRFDDCTVLFADIAGFTAFSSQTPPEQLLDLLNVIFSDFDEITDRFDLEKIKTIGDAYMAVCGLPAERPDHLEVAADTALAMMVSIEKMRTDRFPDLRLRIGLHCGAVIAGVIGKRKFIYDLWGDTVNTASRMESHGEPNRIHVSKDVYERLKSGYVFEPRGAIPVKGKGMMETYFLVAKKK